MAPAPETQMIRPGLFFWQAYDPAVKTDLSCCAFETGEGLVFCDPVALEPDAHAELMEGRKAAGIVLTSANHERDAGRLAKRLGVEVWASRGAEGLVGATRWFGDGDVVCGAEAVGLGGFAAGETAFWVDGALVMGDALIHVAPYGFAMLPEKYCEDPGAGRESLRKLLGLPVEVIMFAHGLPIVAGCRERLAALIG